MKGKHVLVLSLGLAATACSKSSDFSSAAARAAALKNGTLDAFQRSPVIDGKDANLSAIDENAVDRVVRSALKMEELSSKDTAFKASDLRVYRTSKDKSTSSLTALAGRQLSFKDKDLQAIMAYAHTKKAMILARTVLPFANLKRLYPLTVIAAEDGDATFTGYDPGARTITFYRHGKGKVPNFNTADEADAIYHEFGHVVQDAVAPQLLQMRIGDNPDVDGILEGLSDYFAAVVGRDDNTLGYLRSNSQHFVKDFSKAGPLRADRAGPEFVRSVRNELSFPAHYVQAEHLDGRVLAGALNDFRKYLHGEAVQGLADLGKGALSKSNAFDRSLQLAYGTLADATLTNGNMTYYKYAKDMLGICRSSPSGVFSGFAFGAGDCAALERIFVKRGLLISEGPEYTVNSNGGVSPAIRARRRGAADQNVADIVYEKAIGFQEFPSASVSNGDGQAQPCETLMLFPRLNNVSAGRFYGITMEISGINDRSALGSGEVGTPSEATLGNGVVDRLLTFDNQDRWVKILGMLPSAPGASGQSLELITRSDSIWLSGIASSAVVSRPLSTAFFPSALGWMARAPSFQNSGNQACDGAATSESSQVCPHLSFFVDVRPYRALDQRAGYAFTATQYLPMSGGADYCSN